MEEILHQLISSLSGYLQGFMHPRWCRISSINSSNTDLQICRMTIRKLECLRSIYMDMFFDHVGLHAFKEPSIGT